MSILKDFEKQLRSRSEGFFSRAFRSRLQPVELAKAVQRYQGEYQHVGAEAIIVPNVYRFTLSPDDLERFSEYIRALQRELADVARRTADDHGWVTQGPIRIEFERDETIKVGTFELRGKSDSATPRMSTAPPVQQQPVTPAAPPVPAAPVAYPAPVPVTPATPSVPTTPPASAPAHETPMLRAVSGDDNGKVFNITGDSAVIGRLPDCDVTLTSAGVSRRHARIDRTNTGWAITDLDSTNGISVNNQDIKHAQLRPGDRFEIGDVTFSFLLS